MKRTLLIIFAAIAILGSCKKDDPPAFTEFTVTSYKPLPVVKTRSMQIFAHYMPWFEDKTTSGSGKWGWHWTMTNQNPDIVDANGKRQIASHYYPKIGPYASSDAALIEYHLLLMKYSGINGVLIDWYGSTDVNDYGTNRRNTEALVALLEKVGLKFAIVYEDATIPVVMAKTGSTEAVSLARTDMNYIQQKYFAKSSYIKVGGKPLVMVFGPNYFQKTSEWESIIGAFTTKPCFMPLYGRNSTTGTVTSGEFIWVWGSNTDPSYIDTQYDLVTRFTDYLGGAWPGFNDFYKEGGAGNTLFKIDYNNGVTFQDLLNKAAAKNITNLQLITWNDFGEGTMIEPTNEFGYTYLEKLQSFTGLSYHKSDLEAIAQQYALRKSKGSDKSSAKVLDQAFYYWVSLQNTKAIHLIDSIAK
jgi:hypothetical protein